MNTTTSTYGTTAARSIEYPFTFWTFLGMESLLIIIGNVMLIWLFCNNRQLRTLQNYFVMSLSVSDMLVGLTVAPCEYCAMTRELTSSLTVSECQLFCGSVVSFNMLASTFNLVLIAADRFCSIMRPFLYQELFTKRRAKIIIFVAWLFTLCCVCAPLNWQINTNIEPSFAAKLNLAYGITLFSLVMFVGLVIGIGYLMIVLTIRAKMKDMKGVPTNTTGIKVCIMVAISFFLCWIPTAVIELIIVDQKVYPSPVWMNSAYFIMLLNPLLDPLMYAYYRRDFRSQLSKWRQRRWRSIKKLYDGIVFTSSSSNTDEDETSCLHNNNQYKKSSSSRKDVVISTNSVTNSNCL